VTGARAHGWRGVLAAALIVAACATMPRDGLDAAKLPAPVRPDYAVFARRCSKCHQLARPLGADIHDDAEWADYVERTRRQPGSGISKADTKPILRFLHYYSTAHLAAGAADAGSP